MSTYKTVLFASLISASVLSMGLAVSTTASAAVIKANGASSSSTLRPERGVNYDPRQIMDGRQSTSWIEGTPGNGIEDWVQLNFDTAQNVRKVKLWVGLWTSPEYWARGNRPKEVELTFSDGSSSRHTLDDEMRAQTIDLGSAVSTTSVQVKVKSIYSGTTWHDTAISEVQVFDNFGDDFVEVDEVIASSQAAEDSDGNYSVVNLMDGISDSMWCEGEESSDGTGEWLDVRFGQPQTVSELSLVNGMGGSLSVWMRGNRTTEATLEFSDGSKETIKIKNVVMPQKVSFSPKMTSSVKVIFESIVKGTKYNDLCISEARFGI